MKSEEGYNGTQNPYYLAPMNVFIRKKLLRI